MPSRPGWSSIPGRHTSSSGPEGSYWITGSNIHQITVPINSNCSHPAVTDCWWGQYFVREAGKKPELADTWSPLAAQWHGSLASSHEYYCYKLFFLTIFFETIKKFRQKILDENKFRGENTFDLNFFLVNLASLVNPTSLVIWQDQWIWQVRWIWQKSLVVYTVLHKITLYYTVLQWITVEYRWR